MIRKIEDNFVSMFLKNIETQCSTLEKYDIFGDENMINWLREYCYSTQIDNSWELQNNKNIKHNNLVLQCVGSSIKMCNFSNGYITFNGLMSKIIFDCLPHCIVSYWYSHKNNRVTHLEINHYNKKVYSKNFINGEIFIDQDFQQSNIDVLLSSNNITPREIKIIFDVLQSKLSFLQYTLMNQ